MTRLAGSSTESAMGIPRPGQAALPVCTEWLPTVGRDCARPAKYLLTVPWGASYPKCERHVSRYRRQGLMVEEL